MFHITNYYIYDVRINSSKHEIVLAEVYNEMICFCLECQQFTAITINITTVYVGGLRSNPTVKTIGIQLSS